MMLGMDFTIATMITCRWRTEPMSFVPFSALSDLRTLKTLIARNAAMNGRPDTIEMPTMKTSNQFHGSLKKSSPYASSFKMISAMKIQRHTVFISSKTESVLSDRQVPSAGS